MAGYVFNLTDKNSLYKCINEGMYSTIINLPKNEIWRTQHEATFGDYITMKEGDKVFFFHKRKVYGIGELIAIKYDCKLLNFPGADLPFEQDFKDIEDSMIMNESEDNLRSRVICTFKAQPKFFKHGIDMDEILTYKPDTFKMLRAFWKVTFIKLDDVETKSLSDIILKNNEAQLDLNDQIPMDAFTDTHEKIKNTVTKDYLLHSNKILQLYANPNGSLRHEMAIELGILDLITNNNSVFGKWDYLSHQVIASPFKPIDYMDKMDIYGYRYIHNFDTISKYLIIEIKKDTANTNDLNQLMKYVDWVNQEESFGDYNMIEAFLVAYDFTDNLIENYKNIAQRHYTKSRRPPISMEWSNIRLITYKFNHDSKQLEFFEVLSEE